MDSAKDDSTNSLLPINTVNLLFSFAAIMPFVIIPLYARSLGATLFQASLIIGIYWGVQSVTLVFMGSLADIMGRRKPFLIFSLLGTGIMFILISFVDIPVVLILLMGAFGFISAAFVPCIRGLVSEISSKTEKGKNLGLLNTATSFGWAIGSFLSGLITALFNFAMTFYVGCVLAVLAAALTIIFLREVRTDIVKDIDFRKVLVALKNRFIPRSGESTYLKEKGLNWLYFSVYLRYCAYWGSFALLTIFFATIVTTFWIGILLGVSMGLQGFLMTPVGKFSDKIGRKPFITFGLVGTSIVLSLYALSHDLYLLIVAQILNAFVFASISTGGSAFVADVSPKLKYNEAMGYLSSSITFGAVSGTILSGILAEFFGLRAMFAVLAILPVIGLVIVLSRVNETVISSSS